MIVLIARLISILFHPIILSAFTSFFIIFNSSHNVSYSAIWAIFSFMFGLVILLFVLLGIRMGIFSDLDVTKRKERGKLYAFVIGLAFFFILIIQFFKGPQSLMMIGVGVLISAIIMDILNKKLKASIHVAVVAAFICTLALLYGGVFLLLPIIIIPLVAWSRVKMKRHTVSEVIVGGLAGIILTVIFYLAIEYYMQYHG